MTPGSALNLMQVALRRLVVILVALWGAATIAFVAVKLIPGDPVSILTGGENVADQAERAVLVHQYGDAVSDRVPNLKSTRKAAKSTLM
jgi:peptide/nickel transport system permease protein